MEANIPAKWKPNIPAKWKSNSNIVINLGDFWPTSKPLSAVLGTNVLCMGSGALIMAKVPKINDEGGGGCYVRTGLAAALQKQFLLPTVHAWI